MQVVVSGPAHVSWTVARFELVRTDLIAAVPSTWSDTWGRTVTPNDLVEDLPAELVAVHVTVVRPSGNVDPDGGVQIAGIVPSRASVAVAV